MILFVQTSITQSIANDEPSRKYHALLLIVTDTSLSIFEMDLYQLKLNQIQFITNSATYLELVVIKISCYPISWLNPGMFSSQLVLTDVINYELGYFYFFRVLK